MPDTVPTAIEWSPPSTRGKWPRAHDPLDLLARHRGRAGDLGQVARVHVADLELLHVLDGDVAVVHHRVPQLARARSSSPAMRMADGPMSTPRRPEPRSMGTPSTWTIMRPAWRREYVDGVSWQECNVASSRAQRGSCSCATNRDRSLAALGMTSSRLAASAGAVRLGTAYGTVLRGSVAWGLAFSRAKRRRRSW